MADFAQILIRATDQSKGAFDSARNNVLSLQGAASKLNTVLSGLGVGLSVAGLVAYSESVIDLADHLQDLARATKIPIETLASFKLAAEQNGTSLDALAKSMGRLAKAQGEAIQDPSGKSAAALKALSVSSKDLTGGLFQLADSVAKMRDPMKAAGPLTTTLSKNFQELLPLLTQGGEALRQAALDSASFGEAMKLLAPDADKFNDNLVQLKINAATFAVAGIGPVVTGLNTLIDRFSQLQALNLGSSFSFGDKLLAGLSPLKSLHQNLDQVNQDIKALQGLQNKEAGGIMGALFGPSQERRLQELYKLRNALNDAVLAQEKAASRPASKQTDDIAKRLCLATPGGVWDGNQCTIKLKGAAVRDPLADLISGTHSEQLKIYANLQDRLNALWDKGRISGTVYAEALTNLRTKYLAPEIDEFTEKQKKLNEELKKDAEFMQAVSDSDQKAFSEMIAAQQEWADAGRQMFLDMETDSEKFADRLAYIDELWNRGVISIDTYGRATSKAFDDFTPKVEKTKGIMEELGATFESAAENAIVNFKSVGDVLKSLEQDIIRIITRFALNDIFGSIFGKGGFFGSFNISSILGFGGGKADGGPLMPGKWYIAGEKGPEPIWGGGPGAMAMGYGGGGRPVSITINQSFHGQADTRTLLQGANSAARVLRQAARNS